MDNLDPVHKRALNDFVRQWHDLQEAARRPFVPGQTKINYSGYVFGVEERLNLLSIVLDYWLTAGKWTAEFERKMVAFFGSRDFVFTCSGSAANLIMVASLCANTWATDRRDHWNDLPPLQPGDEVVTTALSFPTTVGPIVQHGLVPVFIDCEVPYYNPSYEQVREAVGPKTKAVFLAHTLGLPFDAAAIRDLCDRCGLWFLEDGCDALGATVDGRLVGTFGAMSSLSMYPAHHITSGEGGAVVVNHPRLKRTVRSMQSWGKDCWCDPGKNDTCGKRFGWQLGDLPLGYDHKYIYSNIGYNLKPTDMQAAVACAQADRIEHIVRRRRQNFFLLRDLLTARGAEDKLVLPRWADNAEPSPFGFPITVKTYRGVDRDRVVAHLESKGIETRTMFGGNILRQPGFKGIKHRVEGTLFETDRVAANTFFVGVWPGLTDEMVGYMVEQIMEATICRSK